MPIPVPQNRLTNLELQRFSLVDEGDNPGARILMSKNRDPNPDHDGDGPAVEIETKAKKSFVEKLTGWMTGRSEAKKEQPKTTMDILTEEEFRNKFWSVKLAFCDSVESIMLNSTDEEAGELLSRTVIEFIDAAKTMIPAVSKCSKASGHELLDILSSLEDTVQEKTVLDSPEGFIKAMTQLENFEPPAAITMEDTVSNTKKENDELKVLIAGIEDEELKAKLMTAYEAKPAEKVEGEPDPILIMDDEEEEGADKMISKAIEKRIRDAEAKADAAEAKANKLEEAATINKFRKQAEGMKLGADVETVAKMLRQAEETGDDSMITMVKALSAQARTGRSVLSKSIGAAGAEGASDAAQKIEKAVKSYREANPSTSYHKAYVEVLASNEDLYEEYKQENA